MTDYLNPHKIYPDRVDIAPGFDSDRTPKEPLVVPTVKESLTTECEYCDRGVDIPCLDDGEVSISSSRRLMEVGGKVCGLWSNVEFHINYCPMCGRKLEADE